MRRRRQPISNINVVPYIDVMLVLLVIFMITAPLFNQGVVDLPSVGDKTKLNQQKNGSLVIVYQSSGVNPYSIINYDLDGAESEQMNFPELIDKLQEETLLRPDAPIVIKADGKLEYEEVVKLLLRLQDEGFNNIGLNFKSGEE